MILVTQVMSEKAGKSSLCVKMPKDMTDGILKFKVNCGAKGNSPSVEEEVLSGTARCQP